MLRDVLILLESQYGTPGVLAPGGLLDMIVWENVSQLVREQRRKSAANRSSRDFSADRRHEEKLGRITQLVMELFGGDIQRLLDLPPDQARKALQLFPGINIAGAEKILLFHRRLPVLALDSNGLRSLLRLGYGKKGSTFEATYLGVQDAVQTEIVSDYEWLIRAHHLLRIHGEQICRSAKPRCPNCPVRNICVYARERKL